MQKRLYMEVEMKVKTKLKTKVRYAASVLFLLLENL